MKPCYQVSFSPQAPGPESWRGSFWDSFPSLRVDHFHEASSDHRPVVKATAVHSANAFHVLFQVQDRYIRAAQTAYQSMVCQDSCVEVFIRPRPDAGYLNFEVNCCGVLHCSYITDWTRVEGGFKEWVPVPIELGSQVTTMTDFNGPILDEIPDALTWHATISIPLSLIEHFIGPLCTISGQEWEANFYKCGDKTSHPHWAAWSPVNQLNFHDPTCFGKLVFQ